MDLEQLLARHQERTKRPPCEHRLRNPEYRHHYPLIKSAVLKGVPLLSAIKILQEDESVKAFAGKDPLTVWQAYRRALEKEHIHLTEKPE